MFGKGYAAFFGGRSWGTTTTLIDVHSGRDAKALEAFRGCQATTSELSAQKVASEVPVLSPSSMFEPFAGESTPRLTTLKSANRW